MENVSRKKWFYKLCPRLYPVNFSPYCVRTPPVFMQNYKRTRKKTVIVDKEIVFFFLLKYQLLLTVRLLFSLSRPPPLTQTVQTQLHSENCRIIRKKKKKKPFELVHAGWGRRVYSAKKLLVLCSLVIFGQGLRKVSRDVCFYYFIEWKKENTRIPVDHHQL